MKKLKEKKFIKNIPLYVGGESNIKGKIDVIKLSANENPLGPSPTAIKAYNEISNNLGSYPDSSHNILKKSISKIFKLNQKNIICGCGSDEIINMLCHCFVDIGDEVIHTEHGFAMYKICTTAFGGNPISVKENNRVTDIQNIINACNNKTKIIFIANPNNPTGTMIPSEELEELVFKVPKNILIVLDGAYAEYVDNYDGGLKIVKNNKNVVMLRTFSKIYGLGSLRIGWAFADEKIINTLSKVRGPFNLSSSAIKVASVAMLDQEYVNFCKLQNYKLREWLTIKLKELNISIDKSYANFILARFKSENVAEKVDNYFKKNGLLVRKVSNYNIHNGLRITVGTKKACEKIHSLLFKYRDQL